MATLGHGHRGARIVPSGPTVASETGRVTVTACAAARRGRHGALRRHRRGRCDPAVLDAFYHRVLADATLSAFFLGVDIERLKNTQAAFLAMALGGPTTYTGRTLHDAHGRTRRRGANDDVFDRFLAVFKGVLVDLRVPHAQIHRLLAVFEDARGQILDC